MNPQTRDALRRAGYRRLNKPLPERYTLPAEPATHEDPRLEGCAGPAVATLIMALFAALAAWLWFTRP